MEYQIMNRRILNIEATGLPEGHRFWPESKMFCRIKSVESDKNLSLFGERQNSALLQFRERAVRTIKLNLCRKNFTNKHQKI